ncbi:RHS repeat-associated core domain-containing protein [Xanthomonas bundabergensis]|uniref:RHS repeat-associated core domain-containing protein n=1 Tax=Xanthomonas bundabergensis TaxID=3160842 RepID=UPI0035178982
MQRYDYDPYGNTTQTSTSYMNPYQYTGRERDASGLYYYRARYYRPEWGRFVSEDPIQLRAGPNAYMYARANPAKYRDPSGLWSVTITLIDGFGGAIVFGQDPETDQWFGGGRLGFGVEDGISFDPYGKRPGRDKTPCHGTTVGTYIGVGITFGPWSWNPIQGAAGVDIESGDTYQEGPEAADAATMNPSPKYGLSVGGSMGLEVIGH